MSGNRRRQNGRKHRKTYGFSKDAATHDAATYFIGYSYNFCWAVRTLDIKDEAGSRQQRTPAMAAGLADHVWTLQEWLTYPAKPCYCQFAEHAYSLFGIFRCECRVFEGDVLTRQRRAP